MANEAFSKCQLNSDFDLNQCDSEQSSEFKNAEAVAGTRSRVNLRRVSCSGRDAMATSQNEYF
jgi:hypothetical protein